MKRKQFQCANGHTIDLPDEAWEKTTNGDPCNALAWHAPWSPRRCQAPLRFVRAYRADWGLQEGAYD